MPANAGPTPEATVQSTEKGKTNMVSLLSQKTARSKRLFANGQQTPEKPACAEANTFDDPMLLDEEPYQEPSLEAEDLFGSGDDTYNGHPSWVIPDGATAAGEPPTLGPEGFAEDEFYNKDSPMPEPPAGYTFARTAPSKEASEQRVQAAKTTMPLSSEAPNTPKPGENWHGPPEEANWWEKNGERYHWSEHAQDWLPDNVPEQAWTDTRTAQDIADEHAAILPAVVRKKRKRARETPLPPPPSVDWTSVKLADKEPRQ
jgi:hypothetical protein